MDKIFIFVLSVGLSAFLTWRMRRYALRHDILDIPGNRSSHSHPTPRGGGLGISACCLVAALLFGISGDLDSRLMWAFLGGGTAVAIGGWMDDRESILPLWRVLIHLVAAIWAVYLIRGFPSISIGFANIYLGWIGSILAIMGIIWLTNLYNFMDGIDGIAGAEAVTVGGVGGILLAMANSWGLAFFSWVIAGASLGFLLWNWPPAKIFMGDVGSGFLGFSFAVLILASERSGAAPVLVWLLLLGVFIGDATFTLVRRLFKREKVWEPHRTHFYQRAVQTGSSHQRVTLTVIGINGILSVLSLVAFFQPILLLPALGTGLIVLILFAERVRQREQALVRNTEIHDESSR